MRAALPIPALDPRRAAPGPQARGFTLVEVLVAIFVMASLAAMGWQAVAAMSSTRQVTREATERTLRLQTVLSQFEQDLQAAYELGPVPGVQFDGRALRIVRRQDDGVQLVAWAVREGRWQRWASPPLRQQAALEQWWMTSMQLNGTEPGHLTVLEGLQSWQVFFFRSGAWTNAQSTGDLAEQPAIPVPEPPASGASAPDPASPAPQRSRERLPEGVRLILGLPEGEVRRDLLMPPHLP